MELHTVSIDTGTAVGLALDPTYFNMDGQATTLDAAVPAAQSWEASENCPEIRAYVLALQIAGSRSPVFATFEVPEPYFIVKGELETRPKLLVDVAADARKLACLGAPGTKFVKVGFKSETVVVIATRDVNAPAFWLQIQALWDEPAP